MFPSLTRNFDVAPEHRRPSARARRVLTRDESTSAAHEVPLDRRSAPQVTRVVTERARRRAAKQQRQRHRDG